MFKAMWFSRSRQNKLRFKSPLSPSSISSKPIPQLVSTLVFRQILVVGTYALIPPEPKGNQKLATFW